jgi:hypothetical protein
MTKEQVIGIVRHALTFVGGLFVLKGYLDESLVNEIIGGAVTLVGTIWSVISKSKTEAPQQ